MDSIRNIITGSLLLIIGLKSFSQVTFDHYHGNANINIPLYELNVEGVSIPISLSYTTGGIPLSQQATAVGLGWNLNAEYSVNRFINDIPDDYSYEISGESKTGWLTNYINMLINNEYLDGPFIQDFNNADTSNVETSILLRKINKYLDTQPDNFFYSTTNSSGQFIFDEKPNIYPTIEYNNVLKIGAERDTIEYQLTYDPNLSFETIGVFNITDPNGNKFTYDVKESSSSIFRNLINDPNWQYHYANFQEGSLDRYYRKFFTDGIIHKYQNRVLNYSGEYASQGYSTNIWKVGNIETCTGNRINFTYEEVVYQTDNFTYEIFQSFDQDGAHLLKMKSELDEYAPITYCTERIKRIKCIESDQIKIVFNYNETRLDVGTQVPPPDIDKLAKQLDKIEVYAKTTSSLTLIKEFRFVYSYFDFLTVPNNNLYNTDETAKKRLRLDGVDITDGSTIIGSYKFNYDYSDSRKLPSRFSKAQDFWGYYNGNTITETLLPTTYVYIDPVGGDKFSVYKDPQKTEDLVMTWSDRNPNPDFTSIGSLNKITYPTGGHTEFTYEQNSFMYNGNRYYGPGIRITGITNKTGDSDSAPNVEKYAYEGPDQYGNIISYGKITSMPVFGYFDPTGTWLWQGHTYDPYTGGFANGNNIINDYSDGTLGYSKVIITHGETGEQGRTEMNFENNMMAGEADIYLNIPKPNIYPIKHEYNFTPVKNFNSTVAGSKLDFNNHGYPFIPGTNYFWIRGFLHSIQDYDVSGNKIHEVINEPEYYFSDGIGPKIIYALKQGNFVNISMLANCPNCIQGPLVITAKYPILTGAGYRIKNTTETTFDISNSIEQTVTLNYSYNGFNQISYVQITNSNGIVIQNSIKYPTDYSYTGNEVDDMSKALYKMRKDYHMLDYPIESTSERIFGSIKEVTSGSLSLYKIYDGESKKIVLPNIQLQLQTSQPLNNLSQSEITAYGIFSYNQSYFKPVSYFDKYNTKGKLEESFAKDGSSITNIFASDGVTAIASVANARKNECAYGGFENGDYFFASFYTPLVEDAYTGKYGFKPAPSASANLFVGNEAGKHSGYKASVWVKGSLSASISISVSGSSTSTRSVSNKSPDNVWHLIEVELPYDEYKNNITSQLTLLVQLNGNGTTDVFDDIRILPMDAVMKSMVYNSKLQVIATLDERNIPTRYSYDTHGRNTLIQDQDLNIIKKTEYHIKPQ
jgi:YD repeat-containing protein